MSVAERLVSWFGASPVDPDALPVRTSMGRVSTSTPVRLLGFDQALVGVTLALLIWGLVMVYSASIAMPDNPKFSRYAHNHFLVRHILSLALALVVAVLTFQVPLAVWEKVAPWLFIASLVMLALVLLPFVGKGVNGARRWISLGFMNFQPSELAKFAVLIYASDYMVRKMEVKERFFRAVLPMGAAVALAGVFLLAEPDMGAFMVIAIIAMGILFLGGVNARMFFLIFAVLVGAFVVMIAASPWRRERIFAYLDPFSMEHALGKGYQLSHSLIAIGRGEIWGVGLGGGYGLAFGLGAAALSVSASPPSPLPPLVLPAAAGDVPEVRASRCLLVFAVLVARVRRLDRAAGGQSWHGWAPRRDKKRIERQEHVVF